MELLAKTVYGPLLIYTLYTSTVASTAAILWGGDERTSVPKDTESRGVRNGEGSPFPGKGYPSPALPQPTMCLGIIVSSISYSDIKIMQLYVA